LARRALMRRDHATQRASFGTARRTDGTGLRERHLCWPVTPHRVTGLYIRGMSTSTRPNLRPVDASPSAGNTNDFTPYITADRELPELSFSAVLIGALLGLLFAASSVYLALKIGLTVSASIPIAVLSITIFRSINKALGLSGPQILRNNIVQTTGSAGESIASGVVFTLPALLLLGYELPWTLVAAVALVGGLLGVLLMIPLRESLIVKEHDTLKYPEGTACADVLIVGEERGVQARTVFMGFGIGALYKFLNAGARMWAEVPKWTFEKVMPNGKKALFGEMQAEISPELAGVGFIVGPRIAGYLFGGGVLSYFVLIPAIKLFGEGLTAPMFPATIPISEMGAREVRANYVFYIGAGAVTAAGVISLGRSMPTIWSALSKGFGDLSGSKAGSAVLRTYRNLPMSVVIGGVLLLTLITAFVPPIAIGAVGALLALFFAFLFVTVSSRVTGQIGNSSNPISGMTVATVLLTALIFLAVGWTGIEHRVLALSIGGVVCIAAAVAGATSQDLKTGYLVGATPARQQIGLLVGVTTSALVVGLIISFLNSANTTLVRRDYQNVKMSTIEPLLAVVERGRITQRVASTAQVADVYKVGRLYTVQGDVPVGRYLLDRNTDAVKFVIDPGIGGRESVDYLGNTVKKLDSPKSQIMALVVDGILTQKLPWGLILIGAFLAIAMEIFGINSLPVAVGVYLPISTSATMFIGGVVRWLVDRQTAKSQTGDDHGGDSGPGVLFSSGLIGGGAITGILLAGMTVWQKDKAYDWSKALGAMGENPTVAIAIFAAILLVPLYRIGTKKRTA
jgi:putative OPT family oligopeptide transporter